MHIILALLFATTAGIINGSFSVPTKHVKTWEFENIWLLYSILAFILLPLIAATLLGQNLLQVYALAPTHLIIIMLVGGFLFGIGQVGLALAIHKIGIGLALVICIGLGTGLGFLLPFLVQHYHFLFTTFGLLTLTGTGLAITGLIFSTKAGSLRTRHKEQLLSTANAADDQEGEEKTKDKSDGYPAGVLLAILAGLFSAGQNLTFSLTQPIQKIAESVGVPPLGASNILWPGFLLAAFIPYAIFMIRLQVQNRTYRLYIEPNNRALYVAFSFVMAIFWFLSLILYSEASYLFGSLGPIIGWPIFMILIILTSNFWGFCYKEWKSCGRRAAKMLLIGLSLLLSAFIVLAISIKYQHYHTAHVAKKYAGTIHQHMDNHSSQVDKS